MPKFSYFAIYKPFQVMSQFSPLDGKLTLKDFFTVPTDVYPVGRLDYDSEGLLILTNDPALNHRLLHPSHAHTREYWVQVDGEIDGKAIGQLSKGVRISLNGKQYLTSPANAVLMPEQPKVADRNPPIRFRKNIPAPWIRLTLTEGKNRQVRKMTAAVGFPTLRLIRYRIGNLTLDGLQAGQMRELSAGEIKNLLFS